MSNLTEIIDTETKAIKISAIDKVPYQYQLTVVGTYIERHGLSETPKGKGIRVDSCYVRVVELKNIIWFEIWNYPR